MPMAVTWQGCRLLWRRPTGRWWRSWGSWPWWAWLGWRRSRSGSLLSATDFFPTDSRAWCYKQGQWHCFRNRLHNWCQQNLIVIILVMITGRRCSGDQRRVSVWLLRWLDQAVVSVWGHNNWTQLVWPGQGWDDTWWSVLQICILPAPALLWDEVLHAEPKNTELCLKVCQLCCFFENNANMLKKTVIHQIYRASK